MPAPCSRSAASSSSFSFSARSSTIRSFIARRCSAVLAHLAHDRGLERGERVVVVVGGELLAQVLADLDLRLREQRLHAVLHGDVRLVAEVAGQQLRDLATVAAEDLVDLRVEPLGHLARALDELLVEVARSALELRLDELGVGAGLLAVEDAGADLDRVLDELGRVPSLRGEAHDGLVVDDETVDVQAVGDDAHLGEGETCSFHGYRVAPWQADLTERITLCAVRRPRPVLVACLLSVLAVALPALGSGRAAAVAAAACRPASWASCAAPARSCAPRARRPATSGARSRSRTTCASSCA